MAIIKCPECGHQVSDKAATCPSCGVGIAGNITTCPECGEIVFKDLTLCPNCHCPLIQDSSTTVSGNSRNGTEKDDVTGDSDSKTKAPQSASTGKSKKSYTPWGVSFIIALAIVFVGLYFYKSTQIKNEIEAYQNAMTSSEPAVLQNYLDMYVDAPSEHRDSIISHLEQLKKVDGDWTNAVASGSKSALLRYLQLHPNSIYVAEAKIMIDSLDWIEASQKNTIEAYQKYIDEHADGMYIDQANDAYTQLDAKKVNNDDKARVSNLFSTFFNALGNGDEPTLTSCVDNIMTSFLHKANASKTDVIGYMNKLHQNPEVSRIEYRMNNDWKIEKKEDGNGSFSYSVNFSVDQTTECTDPSDNSFNTYKISAKISSDDKITELNMQRIVQ